jgi:hypothetical protein
MDQSRHDIKSSASSQKVSNTTDQSQHSRRSIVDIIEDR